MLDDKQKQLVNDFEKWWNHELERPIIQVVLAKNKKSQYSRGDLLEMVYNPQVPVKEVAQAYEDTFNSQICLGDAFPQFYMRSTGVLGAYLGQKWKIDNQHGTIWFQETGKELEDIHLKLDKDFWLYQRSIDILKEFISHFKDKIALGIPNLGGMMDIVESMRGANNSLMDLYDDPDEVLRVNDEIFEAYKEAYYDTIHTIEQGNVLGYTGWITLLSQKPYFISQCDFCCMVGKPQFNEFIENTLRKEAQLIERAFYHLDGPGAVRHLDTILECGFDGIQWIPGAGAKSLDSGEWDEIYKKVKAKNKLLQVYIYGKEELHCIDYIVDVLNGDTSGLAFICSGNEEDQEEFIKYLDKYHVPH
jgi:hypothetical protein